MIRFHLQCLFNICLIVLILIKSSDSEIIKTYQNTKLRANSKSLNKGKDITRSRKLIRRGLKSECAVSTCEENSIINLRIYPKEDNDETKKFVQSCSTVELKSNIQKGDVIYLGKVCIDNILTLKDSELIENIEGGTKSTRTNNIRMVPRPPTRPKVDCDGSCCTDCEVDDIGQFLATPVTEKGKELVYNCSLDDPQLVESPIENAENVTYSINLCESTKHVLKRSNRDGDISYFKRQKNSDSSSSIRDIPDRPLVAEQACEVNTCCKTCVSTDAIHMIGDKEKPDETNDSVVNAIVTVKTNDKGIDFVLGCATSVNEEPVIDDTNTIFSISVCRGDWKTIEGNLNVVSMEKVFISSAKTCKKSCSDAVDVLVAASGDGFDNAIECATRLTDTSLEMEGNTIVTMSMCEEDKDILSKMNGIISIEPNYIVNTPGRDVIIPDREKDNITEINDACDANSTECCVACVKDDAKKALVTATDEFAIEFARSCAVNGDEILIGSGINAILGISICEEDWEKVNNYKGIVLEEDQEVSIPQPEQKEREKEDTTKINDACDANADECCVDCVFSDAKKALLTTATDEAAAFARSCSAEDEPLVITDTILAMSICPGDWEKVNNYKGIMLEEDQEVSIPEPEQEEREKDDTTKTNDACDAKSDECCVDCATVDAKKALVTASDEGVFSFARSCAAASNSDPLTIAGRSIILAISICPVDWEKVNNHPGITLEEDQEVGIFQPEQEVAEKKRDKDTSSQITQECDPDECCIQCEVGKNALVTASNAEGIAFARSCAVENGDNDPIAEIGDDTILAMSFCEGDWDKVGNHKGIKYIEEDAEVTVFNGMNRYM